MTWVKTHIKKQVDNYRESVSLWFYTEKLEIGGARPPDRISRDTHKVIASGSKKIGRLLSECIHLRGERHGVKVHGVAQWAGIANGLP